jgi:uncharacterized protein DUF5683
MWTRPDADSDAGPARQPLRRSFLRYTAKRSASRAAFVLGLGLLAAGRACSQPDDPGTYSEEPAGLFYTIDSQPVRGQAQLVGRNRFQGQMPISMPAELMGDYRLRITAPGYETQAGHITFPGSGAPVELGPQRVSFARAIAWPGLAALSSGESEPVRGWGMATAAGVGVTGLVASEIRRRDAENGSGGDPEPGDSSEETAARIQEARDAGAEEAASSARNDWAIFTAATWGLSLLDTYALAPGIDRAQVDLTEVDLTLSPLSRGQAVLRSLIPGFGQTYARRNKAGALAFYGALGSVTGLLMAEHAYEESRMQVNALEDLYQDPGADPEALVAIRSEIEDESETASDREQLRNIMAGITAGVWAINLLDAWIGTPTPSSAGQAGQGLPLRVALLPGSSPAFQITLPF